MESKYYVASKSDPNFFIKNQSGSVRIFTKSEVEEFLKNKPHLYAVKIK